VFINYKYLKSQNVKTKQIRNLFELSRSLSKFIKSAGEEFNEILLRVIDDSLMHIGKSVRPVVYYHLEKDFIKKKEIPVKTERFSACLEMIFGKGVEYLIKMIIVERLYVEIEEELEEIEDYSLTDYVNEARKKYLQKRK